MIDLPELPPLPPQPPQPIAIRTPIIEIEADYGNPLIDGAMILLVLVAVVFFKRALNRNKKPKRDYGPPYGPHNPTGNEKC